MFKSNWDFKLYLEDISNECKNIKTFTKDVTYEEFTDNIEKVYAVVKAFENIDEEFDDFENTVNKILQDLK